MCGSSMALTAGRRSPVQNTDTPTPMYVRSIHRRLVEQNDVLLALLRPTNRIFAV